LGGRVRELAILTTARELDSQFEWAAHEPEAIREGISREIIEIIKHRKDTSGLDEADAIVIELGRQIFGARKVASANLRPIVTAVRPSRSGPPRHSRWWRSG
jgi:4-carboxymuconolactone decarboxylase